MYGEKEALSTYLPDVDVSGAFLNTEGGLISGGNASFPTSVNLRYGGEKYKQQYNIQTDVHCQPSMLTRAYLSNDDWTESKKKST